MSLMSDLPERLVAKIDENMLQRGVAERNIEENESSLNDQLRDVAVGMHDKVVGDFIKRQSAGVIGRQLLNIRGVSNPSHGTVLRHDTCAGRIKAITHVHTPLLPTEPATLSDGHFKDIGVRGVFETSYTHRRWFMQQDTCSDKHVRLRVEQVAQDRVTEQCVSENIVIIDFNIPTTVPPDLYAGFGEWTPREPYIRVSGLPFNDMLHNYRALVEKTRSKGLSLLLNAAARSFTIADEQGISHEEVRMISAEEERKEYEALREKWCIERAKALGVTFDDDMSLDQKESTIKESAAVVKQRAEEEKQELLYALQRLDWLARSKLTNPPPKVELQSGILGVKVAEEVD